MVLRMPGIPILTLQSAGAGQDDDAIELTWWDLLLLALGKTLRDGPIAVARRGRLKIPPKTRP